MKSEYFQLHPRGVNPVLLNDVLFAFHAVTITLVTIVQCLAYKQMRHRISLPVIGILTILIAFLVISGTVCAASKLSRLDFIYYFSYVKLAITIMKYVPQVIYSISYTIVFKQTLYLSVLLKAYLNYKRKSTVGWSIWNVILDFTGGSFSLLQ